MKKHFSSLLLILVFLTGLSLLLYPTISDYWNSLHQSRAVATYVEAVSNIDSDQYEKMWSDAEAYNAELMMKKKRFTPTAEEHQQYAALLDISNDGIMGYVDIPAIKVSLPVYHGVDEAVLQVAVGHLEGSSLPVGGTGTHCVVSGHRGLPSAKLFTSLDRLVVGDVFLLQVLDITLTYEVDQILIVEPDNFDGLEIEEDKDYCTLLTCTPYGINTHRLLVRGHRIDNLTQEELRVTSDAVLIDPVLVAPLAAAPMLLLLLLWVLIKYRRRS